MRFRKPSLRSCPWVRAIQYQDKLGNEMIERSPAEKDLGNCWMKNELSVCAYSPESQSYLVLHKREQGQQV